MRRRRRDNLQMNFYSVSLGGRAGGVDWIRLAQRRDWRPAVVNTVTKLSVAVEVMCVVGWLSNWWLYK